MNQPRTIETNVENVRDAMLRAGFRPGRRVRVSVEYIDAREVREAEYQRLTAILDQYPLPPELQGMTEEESLALADEVISEVRKERRNTGK